MDIRRGVIRDFDSGTYLADVQIVGSMATVLTGVSVAKQIGADLVTSGSKCGVLFFDETNPSDACVVFIYGEAHPGHITIPQGKEFRPGGDANTAFGEDEAGNAYIKDAIAGTFIASRSSIIAANGSVTLSTSWQDVPGLSKTFTPPYACRAFIIATVSFVCQTGNDVGELWARIDVDGNERKPLGQSARPHPWQRTTITAFHIEELSAASHTIKAQVRKMAAAGTADVPANTSFMAIIMLPNKAI